MNKTVSYIIGGLAIVALVVAFVAFNKAPVRVAGGQGPQGEKGLQGDRGPQGPQGVPGKDGVSAKLGAITSNVIPYADLTWGGVRTWNYRTSMLSASTTVCNIQTPVGTTTLRSFWVDLQVGTSSAAHIQMASSPTPDATTTVIAQIALPATVAMQFAATSTLAGQVLPGSSWLVVKSAPTTGANVYSGTVSDTGYCGATFQAIQN
jgi:hypothetical protein